MKEPYPAEGMRIQPGASVRHRSAQPRPRSVPPPPPQPTGRGSGEFSPTPAFQVGKKKVSPNPACQGDGNIKRIRKERFKEKVT